jgi:hypothetical protein
MVMPNFITISKIERRRGAAGKSYPHKKEIFGGRGSCDLMHNVS